MWAVFKAWIGVCLLAGTVCAAPVDKPQTKGRTGWFGTPILAYTPETGTAFGAAVLRYFMLPGGRDSVARLDARYTTREQIIIRSRNRIYWNDNFLRTWVSYERFPDQYYGVGGNTPNDPESYTPIEWRSEVVYERRIWERLFVGGAFELTHLTLQDVVAGGLLDADTGLTGRAGGWQSGVGIQLTWDDRDNVNATWDGTFARASFMAFDGLLGSDYDYRRTTFDVRQFIPLPFEHVLAMRALARINSGDTPFYDLSMLGGRTLMRGIYEGRFRDNHALTFQVEYRLPIWWRFGLAAFAATGQVADTLGDLDFRHSRFSGGGGLRIAVSQPSRLNLRVDLGASADGNKLYITFNEAF